MKNLLSLSVIAFLGASFFTSCINEDNTARPLSYVTLRIDSVAMPDTATLGKPVKIMPYVRIKEACQAFQAINYNVTGEEERTIVAIGIQQAEENCSQAKSVTVKPFFHFQPMKEGTYTLKFFKEKKDESIYINKKIVIKK